MSFFHADADNANRFHMDNGQLGFCPPLRLLLLALAGNNWTTLSCCHLSPY